MKVFVVVLSLCIFAAVTLSYKPARENPVSGYDKDDDDNVEKKILPVSNEFLDLRKSILWFLREKRKHKMEEQGIENFSLFEGFDEDIERANMITKQILKRKAVKKFFSNEDAETGRGTTISGSSATHNGLGHNRMDWRKICCPNLPCCHALPPI